MLPSACRPAVWRRQAASETFMVACFAFLASHPDDFALGQRMVLIEILSRFLKSNKPPNSRGTSRVRTALTLRALCEFDGLWYTPIF